MKRYILSITLATIASIAIAQNGIDSPYSRYGFGLLSERATGFNKGMGGVAQGFRNGTQINIANPASYSEVDSLTALFDLGISLQNGNYKMDKMQQNIKNSSFDYFAMQFRAFRNIGMSLGIMPISNMKYNLASEAKNLEGSEDVTTSYTYNGDGGLREVFLGAGWRPFKPISIGFNVSYLWGDYSHTMQESFSQSSAFSLARTYSANISSYRVQGGIQFIQSISKKNKIVIGATYTLGHNTNNDAYCSTRTISSSTTQTETIDTIKNAFQLPHQIAAGITYYHSNRLRIGADFELQKWSDCKFPNQRTSTNGESSQYVSTKGQLYDRTKWSGGLDWTPNSEGSYFKRATYKVGGYYSQSYANADITGKVTDKPYELGVSAGITLPISSTHIWHRSNSPKINISAQWVHTNIPYLNTTTATQKNLTENYLKLCVGITFNERWFHKWKVQ